MEDMKVRMRTKDGNNLERDFSPEHAENILAKQRAKKITNGWEIVKPPKKEHETSNSGSPKAD